MAPMETNYAGINGEVTEAILRYYSIRARGGAGGIIVEASSVKSPEGNMSPLQLRIDNNAYISGHAALVESIHSYDCKAFAQLAHAGRQTTQSITKGVQVVAPSEIP